MEHRLETAPSSGSAGLPLVSVIIPVRNGKDYIQEALDSVFAQDYAAVEILVIDDGSTDFEYATLGLQDRRIHVIRLEGRGVSHARNTGMRLANGDYFAFLDADDVWFPGKLKAQIGYFERHPQVGLVFGGFIRWPGDSVGKFVPASELWSDCSHLRDAEPARSGWLYTRLLQGLLVGMNTAVIRKSIQRSVGEFNESMRIGEDYDFWLRTAQVTEMHALAGPVALYRIHSSSAMHRLDADNHLARLLDSAHARWGLRNPDGTSLSAREFKQRLARTHFSHGYAHYWGGDPAVACQSFAKSFMGGSRRTRSLVYCGLSALKSGQRRLKPSAHIKPPAASAAKAGRGRADGLALPDLSTPVWARLVSATLCRSLSGPAARSLTIFTFHKVPDEADAFESEFTAQRFARLIEILVQNFHILPLEEGIARLQKNDLPPFAVALSFDDGYPNWFDGVIPVLERHAIPATFFISTCQLEGHALWFERLYAIERATKDDRAVLLAPFRQNGLAAGGMSDLEGEALLQTVKYLPTAQRDGVIGACEEALGLKANTALFTAADVGRLRAKGFTIGAHTVNHPILASCSKAEAQTEITRSREMLTEVLREPINLFSYPNGVPGKDIRPDHVRIVQDAGFRGAVTTAMGAATHATSIFQLPRFDPWARTRQRLLLQYLMIQNRRFPLIAEQPIAR